MYVQKPPPHTLLSMFSVLHPYWVHSSDSTIIVDVQAQITLVYVALLHYACQTFLYLFQRHSVRIHEVFVDFEHPHCISKTSFSRRSFSRGKGKHKAPNRQPLLGSASSSPREGEVSEGGTPTSGSSSAFGASPIDRRTRHGHDASNDRLLGQMTR